jgi:hypothetical protein
LATLFAGLPATLAAAFLTGFALLAGFDLADLEADDLRSAEDERAAILFQPVFMRFIHNAAIT